MSVALGMLLSAAALAGTQAQNERMLAATGLKDWASHPTIIDAVRAQNLEHKDLSAEQIAALNHRWRQEMTAVSKPMIQAVMANALSSFLTLRKRASGGLYTEIVVMDDRGLAVGVSDAVANYWQGGDDRWRKTYLVGPDAVHVQDIVQGNGPRRFQSRISLPVVDPVTRKPIGALSVAIDCSRLSR